MKLSELIKRISTTKFKCTISGVETEGYILQINIVTGKALVKLDRKIKTTESDSETDELWLDY